MRSFGVAFFHAYKNRPGLNAFTLSPGLCVLIGIGF
nr:MAG TPA: hypothetical protein [Bacteriophage sp.]